MTPLCRRSLPWLLLAAACGGGGSAAPPTATTILATAPADGARDVEPATVLQLQLAVPPGGIAAGDVAVRDGGNELPGALQTLGGGSFLWLPQDELPRGSRIEVHSRAQGRVATFTVRSARPARSFELPGELPAAAYAWPNGRLAVLALGGRVFEVVGNGLVERPAGLPRHALLHGDGGFVASEWDPQLGTMWCVRGDLDGRLDRIATPFGAPVAAINRRGDAVAFVPQDLPCGGCQGLWRLGAGEVAWQHAAPLLLPATTAPPDLDGAGGVAIAEGRADRVLVHYAAPGAFAATTFELPFAGDPFAGTRPRLALGEDGRGLLAWQAVTPTATGSEDRLHLARFLPSSGLELQHAAAAVFARYLLPPGFVHGNRLDAVSLGELGSAALVLSVGGLHAGGFYSQLVLRAEPDGRIVGPEPYAPGQGGSVAAIQWHTLVTPRRGELVAVRNDLDGQRLWWRHSRPGAPVADEQVLYTAPPGLQIGTWFAAADDRGRVLLAVSEYGGPLPVGRVVVVE